jgi:hypothetical protein
LDVSKDGNGNLIRRKRVVKNFVAFEDKEMGGIKGVNLAMKQAHKDKKNATCFMVKNTIPMTFTECFPTNSRFHSGVSAVVIMRKVNMSPLRIFLTLPDIMRMTSPASMISREREGFQDSLLDVLKDGDGNLIESNEIIENFVALKDK